MALLQPWWEDATLDESRTKTFRNGALCHWTLHLVDSTSAVGASGSDQAGRWVITSAQPQPKSSGGSLCE